VLLWCQIGSSAYSPNSDIKRYHNNTDLLTRQSSYVFTYSGDNNGLIGFFNAIQLVCETGFAMVAFVSLILNLVLPEEEADEELPELTADNADDAADAAEWNRLHGRPQPTDGVAPAQSEVKA
jgi:hypothetical protein